ncbi:MAG: hypothetical protein ABIQ39_02505 [Ilumatobacteraceae bacterium]
MTKRRTPPTVTKAVTTSSTNELIKATYVVALRVTVRMLGNLNGHDPRQDGHGVGGVVTARRQDTEGVRGKGQRS